MLPWWSIVLGTTVLVWKITSQGLRFYSYCCNADPCMGIAYTNWLCCHDSLGGTSLVWWISSQACSSSSFQSADDHIEVVKMCWHRYEDRVNICTRRRGVSSWICRYFSSLIVFALCKPYWIVEYKFIITSFEEFLNFVFCLFCWSRLDYSRQRLPIGQYVWQKVWRIEISQRETLKEETADIFHFAFLFS